MDSADIRVISEGSSGRISIHSNTDEHIGDIGQESFSENIGNISQESFSERISVESNVNEHIGNIGQESVNVVAPASYNDFDDKPSINEVELIGNKELPDLQVESLTNLEIESLINSIV